MHSSRSVRKREEGGRQRSDGESDEKLAVQRRAPLQLAARFQSDVALSSLIEGGGGGGGDRGHKGGGVMSVFAGKCSASQEKDKAGGKGEL